jgi:hypothetical protein
MDVKKMSVELQSHGIVAHLVFWQVVTVGVFKTIWAHTEESRKRREVNGKSKKLVSLVCLCVVDIATMEARY